MITLVTYLIKFSVSLTLVYAFYMLLLKRLTFYNWNRLFLLIYSLACFLIPFINVDSWLTHPDRNTNILLKTIPPYNEMVDTGRESTFNTAAPIIFAVGALIVLLRFFIQYCSLRRINKNAVLLQHAGKIRIYATDSGSSFTLGNNIYLDTAANHSPHEMKKFFSTK